MADELAALLKTFTDTQMRFLECRLRCNKTTEAATMAGIGRTTYYEWENRADIDRAVELIRMDGVILTAEILRRAAPDAAHALTANLKDKRPQVRHNAAVEVLNRTVGKPVEKQTVDMKQSGEVTLIVRRVKSGGLLGFAGAAPSTERDSQPEG
jgi:hypothetical protein